MQVEVNSVWLVSSLDGSVDGLYRVLAIYSEIDLFIMFLITEDKKLERPISVPLSSFIDLVKQKLITVSEYELPAYLSCKDEDIPKAQRLKRDKTYQMIFDLVSSPDFLLDIATNSRSKLLVTQAKKQKTYVQKIYRTLNLFWKYGQEPNALLPAYKLSGGLGKERPAGNVKRGRPVQIATPTFSVFGGVNTEEDDKTKIQNAMRKFGLKGKNVPFSKVYEQMLKEFYSEELLLAESQQREPIVPGYRSFLYWAKKLIPQNELIRRQTNKGDFERNRRGLIGSATDHTEVPGSCFELDATVLDVHIVSEFQRNHVLGRPTLYCLVDKESRMIVGLHVSMEYASWRAGRQALVNAFTSKKQYCERFGIEIEEGDWPCQHIPQRLLCDRGEFICKDAEQLAVPLIGHLSIAPPYRADWKGTVEIRFKILNDTLVHQLMGTTRGRHFIRGDKDPRLDAALTLNEVTKMLIDAVLEHNSSIFESLAAQTTLLIEFDLKPTPLNYWAIHLKKHRHALIKANEADIRARLLPPVTVSMTSKGIRLNKDMYYQCEREEFDSWKTIARNAGSWKLEARIDQDNSSFIYVRLQSNENFTRCELMKLSSIFEDRHIADVVFFEDWKTLQLKKNKPGKASLERYNRKNETIRNAKESLKSELPLHSKAEKTRDMKERRRQVILDNRLKSDDLGHAEELSGETTETSGIASNKKNKVISLLKRKKDE
ncbi:transposase [Vibrio paracholerae]|uniref:DDE-type integrase/transposase/recombinase n=1 Tax=Vibrio paracholerae TaxID=650003 RepID=UPI000A11148A|nr:DDE-type integrase/transposase/recombinase [Vibrio paracholerae]ORP18366.1 transposase [Vibrio paracholerae]